VLLIVLAVGREAAARRIAERMSARKTALKKLALEQDSDARARARDRLRRVITGDEVLQESDVVARQPSS